MLFAEANQGLEMPHMTVDTPVGHQSEQMNRFVLAGSQLQAVEQCPVAIEVAIFDSVVDSYQILTNYAATTQGQVADFGVAHLPVWQTHRMA